MTRENKVALVVGFALILFVGILISDHFSVARAQQAANLIPNGDPTDPRNSDQRYDNPTLLDMHPGGVTPTPYVREPAFVTDELAQGAPGTLPREEVLLVGPRFGEPVSLRDPLNERPVVQMPDLQARQPDKRPQYRVHVVSPNESLTSICAAYYDDTTLVKKLAAYNNIQNPNLLRRGQSLKIPELSALVHGLREQMSAGAGTVAAERDAPVSKAKTYTVKPGDTLSEIAMKTMGSGRKWHRLYEYNEDVIDDADHLVVGVVLKIPE